MVDITKSGGATASLVEGGAAITDQISVDPDNWVETLVRSFKWYLEQNFDLDIYEIIESFPSANDLGKLLPLNKTIIHFEIDDVRNPVFGFGRNVVSSSFNESDFSITEYEALAHDINFDIGIWASARSGGVTARLRAYQLLNNLFAGAGAFIKVSDLGFEIKGFNGSSFIKEEIDDIDIFRITNITLMARVFSRRPYPTEIAISGFIQDQNLSIGVTVSGFIQDQDL